MKVVRITESDRDACLEYGIMPIPNDLSREAFAREWGRAYTAVRVSLEKSKWKCFPNSAGDDFCMSGELPHDRVVFIEISNEEMLNSELVPLIQESLLSIEQEYIVAICNAMGVLRTMDGDEFPWFDLFIEHNRVRVYSASDETLVRLGLSPNTFQPPAP